MEERKLREDVEFRRNEEVSKRQLSDSKLFLRGQSDMIR